MKCRQIVS